MESSLKRLLRLRALQEELAGLALGAEAARLREIDGEVEQAAAEGRASRERWFQSVQGSGEESLGRSWNPPGAADGRGVEAEAKSGAEDGRVEGLDRRGEELAWELAVWRGERAENRRPAQAAAVERAREEFLDGRRDRMQVETLLAAGAMAARRAAERREQRQLDDWYRSRLGGKAGWRLGDSSDLLNPEI